MIRIPEGKCGTQVVVQRVTNIHSALTTLQACIILLYLRQFAVFASAIPSFKLFYGALC
jgi:hypothetical protein